MGLERCFRSRARIAIYFLVLAISLAIITASIAIAVYVSTKSATEEQTGNPEVPSVRNDDVQWPRVPSDTENRYRYASVACAEKNCSTIGVQVLAEGGSAVDSLVATSLCIGVARFASSGIGGGGFMVYYNRSSGEEHILDYRETAPNTSHSHMYQGNLSSKIGGGSIGVPGEVAGLWEAHQKFGKLPWSQLFQPAIRLARNGFTLNDYVSRLVKKSYPHLNEEARGVFTNPNGEMKTVGDTVVLTKLADTLGRIAEGGAETFYRGALKDDIIKDLEDIGDQYVMSDDLRDYKTEIRTALKTTLRNGKYKLISMPPPSGGVVVQYILNILDGYNFTKDSVSPKREDIKSTSTTYHRIVEAIKFAYGARMNLGDPKFVDNIDEYVANMTDSSYGESTRAKITDDTTHDPEYYGDTADARPTTGTSQISILAGNGDAISVTTTINFGLGSKRMGSRTGIIFNNEMDDFSKPAKPDSTDPAWVEPLTEANWVKPGKRPLSSMSPTIVLDEKGDVLLVTGGSGGKKIITATMLTLINNLWFGMNATEAVTRPRLHHQLLPNEIAYEKGFPEVYLDQLRAKNHTVVEIINTPVSDSVANQNGVILGVGDFRRKGVADGF